MEREWIEAGFFVLSDGTSPERGHRLLPARIVTVSTCVVDIYPDSWALPWVQTSADKLRGIRESLALDDADFADLRSWVGRAFDGEDIGWPNVFFSLRAAREFSNRFLRAVEGTRLRRCRC